MTHNCVHHHPHAQDATTSTPPPPTPLTPNHAGDGDSPSTGGRFVHGRVPTDCDEPRRGEATRRDGWLRWRTPDLLALYREIEETLLTRAGRTCSGNHRPTDHRDGKPPWCRFCGRTELCAQVASPSTTVARAAAGHRARPERTTP